ncbi:ABC transporter permease [Corynebacterium heidelbergense]|nr:ABC transporter permease [Corynebacterium heidelbergense]
MDNNYTTTDRHDATPDRQDTAERFPVGQFRPDPRRSSAKTMLLAQAKIESLLFLRHGEQQLISLIIPIGLLVGFSLLPFVPLDHPVYRVFPMALAVAIMGAGFTGQAIAVAFDRKYGALKRIGASGVPTWALIGGKIVAVGAVVVVQLTVLTVVALLLGWRPEGAGVFSAIIFVVLGVAAFTSLGLALGGTLSSEMTLAIGNTIWFVFLGAAAFATISPNASEGTRALLHLFPSVALTEGLRGAAGGSFNALAAVVLAVWAGLGSVLVVRFFSFTTRDD